VSLEVGWHEIVGHRLCGMCADDIEDGDNAYWTGWMMLCGECAVDEGHEIE